MILNLQEVKKLNKSGNVIPLYKKLSADLDTPVSVYLKIKRRNKQAFLLESIEGGEKLARYSFIGVDPFLTVEADNDEIRLIQGKIKKLIKADPIEFLKEMFSFYQPVNIEDLPRFTGGAVGYFSYDCIRWVEDIPAENRPINPLPQMYFSFYKSIIAFDHLKQEIILISNILHQDGEKNLNQKYKSAKEDLAGLEKLITGNLPKLKETKQKKSRVKDIYSEKEYTSMVRKAKKYIKEGDIFQVVLSQRWEIKSESSPLQVYRNLRRINPSPYMFLIESGNSAVIGSSPEMLVRVEKNQIETRPIAGTRPRGKNDAEDEKRIADLMSDEKEIAEHTMLLDLGRNDIGRVAKAGTVEVSESMVIEKYSHVIHIVSSVVGKVKKQMAPLDGFFACFPAGTVSGAPKIRAMEIIDELEKEMRSVYAGSIAYLDFWGNLDSCIAIRTVVKYDKIYSVQAGAGIVADSKPKKEFLETKAKAQVLINAITGEI